MTIANTLIFKLLNRHPHYVVIFAALFLAFQPKPSFAEDHQRIIDQVTIFHSTLITAMKNADELGRSGRSNLINPVYQKVFNTPLMARIVVGRRWRQTSSAQKQRFTSAFQSNNVAIYANRFDGYSGQSFKNLGTRPGPKKTLLIDTVLINPGNDNVKLTYVAKRIKNKWWIIDVLLASGISELAVKRSEYSRTLKTKGIDALTDILLAKSPMN